MPRNMGDSRWRDWALCTGPRAEEADDAGVRADGGHCGTSVAIPIADGEQIAVGADRPVTVRGVHRRSGPIRSRRLDADGHEAAVSADIGTARVGLRFCARPVGVGERVVER